MKCFLLLLNYSLTSLFLQYKWNVPAFLTSSTVYTDMESSCWTGHKVLKPLF